MKVFDRINRHREDRAWEKYDRLNRKRKSREYENGGIKVFKALDDLRRKIGYVKAR